MTKPLTEDVPKIIYLIDMGDDIVWCDDAAPGVGMDSKDAVKYIRADTRQQTERNQVIDECVEAVNNVGLDADDCAATKIAINALKDKKGGSK